MAGDSLGKKNELPLLSEFSVVAFDLYSTLIDREQGLFEALLDSLARFPEDYPNPYKTIDSERRDYLLSRFEWQQAVCQKEHPMVTYITELEQAHYRLMAQDLKIDEMSQGVAVDFSESIFDWPAFDDALSALSSLRDMGYKIVLVSNLETEIMAHTLRESLEGFKVDWIYSGNNIMTYKPDSKNLASIVENIGHNLRVDRSRIMYLSSGFKEDLEPANQLGLMTVSVTHNKVGAQSVGIMSDEVANMSLDGMREMHARYRFESLTQFANACKQHRAHRR